MKAPCTANTDIFETAYFFPRFVWTEPLNHSGQRFQKCVDSSGRDLNFMSHEASCTCARHVVFCEILREDICWLHTRSEVSFK